jgi:large subunit ribosomal protein L22
MVHIFNYQKPIDPKRSARSQRVNLPISSRYGIEFSNYFMGKKLDKAIIIASNIMEMKDHLPLVRFRKKVAHRKGEAKRGTPAGRFPVKAATEVKKLLEEVKANAENKNLDAEKLRIIHMFATKGVQRSKMQPLGRISGKNRKSKSTNIEVIVLEE